MIIPSIDLMVGKAVQLKQGREKMLERNNPIELVKIFDQFGQIAVIDLNAAMGKGNNRHLIKEICKIAECRVGGGIRTINDAREIMSYGAIKVIIGTKAFENNCINLEFLEALSAAIGRQHIMIAIDAFEREIVTGAWQHKTGLQLFDVVKGIEPYASEFLFTCVEKEGGLRGTDLVTIQELKKVTSNKLTVAGGITSMDEIVTLARLRVDAQLGMALYTGKLKLEDAFIESLNWKADLLPTVTCDQDGQVLMLAYSNKESLGKTFETGNMWYYSRSRNKLWKKGDTSGNTQKFIRIRTDCDQDTLLTTVEQEGVACHQGNYSCFGDKKFNLNDLYNIVQNRIKSPMPESYTATLTFEKLKEKILEEAKEVIEAETKEDIIWEVADILYFLTVLLAKNEVGYDDVIYELRRRRRQ